MRFLAAVVLGTGLALASTTGVNAGERPFSWTGFYLGGTLGYAWGHSSHCDAAGCLGGFPDFPQPDPKGVIVGVTAGYNYQVGQVVLGIEVD